VNVCGVRLSAIVQCFEIPSAVVSGVSCASDVLAAKYNKRTCKNWRQQGMVLVFSTGVDKLVAAGNDIGIQHRGGQTGGSRA